jgi:hypothetical protein
LFSWLDSQNFRFRFPRLHSLLLRSGNRDAHYRKRPARFAGIIISLRKNS